MYMHNPWTLTKGVIAVGNGATMWRGAKGEN